MNENKQAERTEFRDIVFLILPYWRRILIFLIFSILVAYLYSSFSTKIYSVSAKLLIKKERPLLDISSIQPTDIYNNSNDVNNEIEVIHSTELIEKTLERLDLGIAYYQRTAFSLRELYKDTPFVIETEDDKAYPFDCIFNITFKDTIKYILEATIDQNKLLVYGSQNLAGVASKLKIRLEGELGKPLNLGFSTLLIKSNSAFNYDKNWHTRKYSFSFISKENLIKQYSNLILTPVRSSTVLRVSVRGTNADKIVDFLNTFCRVYLERSVEKKLRASENTIMFIEGQLDEISDSLKFSEDKLQIYRSAHKVMDMDYQSQQVFNNLQNIQNQKAELIVRYKYFLYLKDYLDKNNDGKGFIAPSTIGINDPVLNSLLTDLVNILGDRAEVSQNIKKDNPYITSYNVKIEGLKKTLYENIRNSIDATNISLKELEGRINDLSEKASKLPKTQRDLFRYERVFKLNDALYTYLLTKRSEIQISKAALIPDNEVIEKASRRTSMLVFPRLKYNLLWGIVIGLLAPIIIILVFSHFDDRVKNLNEIERISGYPILGNIVKNKLPVGKYIPVVQEPKSLIAESFRSVKANLQYVCKLNERPIILISSALMDEGKSFISLNLAAIMANNGLKTALLCFDLRKKMRNIPLDLDNSMGLSNYLSSNCKLEDIINKTAIDNLDILLPGPVPPNPNELISSETTSGLLKTLKQAYDVVILDTPPVGMVADALLLMNYTDVNLFVIRHNQSRKGLLKNVFSNLNSRSIKHINVVINDIPVKRATYGYGNYGYGYNYNYGYGYGYYHEEKRPFYIKWLKFLNRKKE